MVSVSSIVTSDIVPLFAILLSARVDRSDSVVGAIVGSTRDTPT